MSSRLSLPVRSALAAAIALMLGHTHADQSPQPPAPGPGSESGIPGTPGGESAQNPQPPQSGGPDDTSQQAEDGPITEQGITGELFHTMLGLSMQEDRDGYAFSNEIITAFPVDWKTMQPNPDYDPAWPTLAVHQSFQLVQQAGGAAPEYTRTPDGHFFLASSDFIYSLSSGEGGHDPNPPQRQSEHPAEYVLNNRSHIPVQVTPEGIILSSKMRLHQTAMYNGPDLHEMEAPAPKAIARTDIVPFNATIQEYQTDAVQGGSYDISIRKGEQERQIKLCGYSSFSPVHRNTCVVWSVPENWQFGMALNFDRIEVTDARYFFPSELTEGSPQTWVTRSQPWPRL